MRVASNLRHLAFYPLTAAALAALLLVPAFQIARLSAPFGRDRQDLKLQLQALSREADLVLSHDIRMDRSAPEIWIQRLGAEQAADRWRALQGQIWWMAWMGDGAPVLILPGPSAAQPSSDSEAAPGVQLLFADALHEKVFRERPLASTGVPSRLETVCLDRLMSTSAVRWRPAALSSLAGVSSVLLQSAAHGCLSLSLKGKDLRFSGFVSPRPLASAPDRLRPSAPRATDQERSSMTPVDDATTLLHLHSHPSSSVLRALLERPLIKRNLESAFGVTPKLRTLLLEAPMALRLHRLPGGPYQAALEIDLKLASPTTAIQSALEKTKLALQKRGLSNSNLALINPDGRSVTESLVWSRPGGPPLGGWAWFKPEDQTRHLRFSLGAPPSARPVESLNEDQTGLSMVLLPAALSKLALLPGRWPAVVRQADGIKLWMSPLTGDELGPQDWFWLDGQLSLP